jgi:hypothetical protein
MTVAAGYRHRQLSDTTWDSSVFGVTPPSRTDGKKKTWPKLNPFTTASMHHLANRFTSLADVNGQDRSWYINAFCL